MSAEITEWIDPAGTFTTLDVDWEATDRFMPPPIHLEDAIPGEAGGVHRETRHDMKTFTIRLTVTAATESALRTSLRSLVFAMDPTRGEGRIRVTSPVGDVREIACYYVSGLGLEEKPENSGPTMQQATVTFKAYEPYWRDSSDIVQTFTIGAAPIFFPIFPIRLTASQIAVDATAANNGDVDAWPVWQITGPGSTIYLRNLGTGEVLWFDNLSLGTGEKATIDTKTALVTKQDGTNLYPNLNIGSTLWSLKPGSTALRLEMAGALVGVSALQLNYRQRYDSP